MADNPYILDQKTHDEVFEIIKKDFLSNSQSVEKPGLVITGGQPASGKGKLAGEAALDFANRGGSVIVDPDRLRQYHPQYEALQESNDKTSSGFTHPDAKKWSLELAEEAVKGRKNIILDQTSADYDTLKNTVAKYREADYQHIELKIMAVPEMTSEQGIYHRYEMEKQEKGTGRFVSPEVHHEIYDKLANTVQRVDESKIVDRFTVYDRYYKPIQQKDFERERNREFTPDEKSYHDYKWTQVTDLMKLRDAPYQEIVAVQLLQERDREKLNIKVDEKQMDSTAHNKAEIGKQADPVKAEKEIDQRPTAKVYIGKYAEQVAQLETNLENSKLPKDQQKEHIKGNDKLDLERLDREKKDFTRSIENLKTIDPKEFQELKEQGYKIEVYDLSKQNSNQREYGQKPNINDEKQTANELKKIVDRYQQSEIPKPGRTYEGVIMSRGEDTTLQKTATGKFIVHETENLRQLKASDMHRPISIKYESANQTDVKQITFDKLRQNEAKEMQASKGHDYNKEQASFER